MAPLSPADAEVALRTFSRRWRELLGGLDQADPDTEALLQRPGPDGRSALECALAAGAALGIADDRLREALRSDRPTLTSSATTAGGGSLESALGRIDSAAPALADTIAGTASGDLDREAELDGRTVTVRSLITDTVSEVAGLLRAADEALHARP